VVLLPLSVGSSGDVGVVEDVVGGEVVNLVFHASIEAGDSVDEHLDDLVEDLVFLVASRLFGSPELTLGVEVIDGVVKGRGGLEVNLPSLVFVSLGGDDGDEELVLVGGLGGLLFVQMLEFGFGILEP